MFLRQLPKGAVITYGQLAKVADIKSPRQIGKIMHNNPNKIINPCFKVVFSDGSLSKSFAFGGINAQKKLLENEGIILKNDRVNLQKNGIYSKTDFFVKQFPYV